MKTILSLLIVMALTCQSFAQNLPAPYKLDGHISIVEYTDTTILKTAIKDLDLIIRQQADYYYIGIRSNTQTIANAYYKSESQLKVMHASAALGEANYMQKEQEGPWVKDQNEWDWRYRDSNYWEELHENPITDFTTYYREFGWVANTVSHGSYREMEMIISKEIVEDINNLFITYTKQDKENRTTLKVWSLDNSTLTGDRKIDLQLHIGNLPATLNL